MRHLLLLGLLGILLSSLPCFGQRLNLKPLDFQPLTGMPWQHHEDVSLEKVLERIFLEPNPAIRHAVLAAYLRLIPVEAFPQTFDLCIRLQGTQWPDDLVALMLPIWAERDPQAAWKRTQTLFSLIGFHWLGLDAWGNPRIQINNLEALRGSSFWLREGLETFPQGLSKSKLPRAERIAILSDFVSRYLAIYGFLPETRKSELPSYTYSDLEEMVSAFQGPDQEFRGTAEAAASKGHEGTFEVLLRRWLVHSPEEAADIVAFAEKVGWPPEQKPSNTGRYVVSQEWLLLWAKIDKAGMMAWVEHVDLNLSPLSARARGLLLGLANQATGQRWLDEAGAKGSGNDDILSDLLMEAAPWAPQLAMEVAVTTSDAETIRNVSESAVYDFQSQSWNTSHMGLGLAKDFPIETLPPSLLVEVIQDWGVLMEQWGDVDVGEAARYGFQFLTQTNLCPQENLIKLFAGDDTFSSDGDMIDRTFCALRSWAILQPDAMKAWIGQQQGADMRAALTWLLENPWGTGELK
ncbi:hypothetical protein [Prosthecobacter dejongeii]|uniref:Uncharacterized protein n=1 Tax=Prosthecobacter dejongeii TaxID=48465 RepID=A0A7W7YGN6_9BACT|nr:hypothetical protein [Prosthecobacter dejongeii]MBB5035851.1 hypothetical protein [Prosthecobacter dejongeii]